MSNEEESKAMRELINNLPEEKELRDKLHELFPTLTDEQIMNRWRNECMAISLERLTETVKKEEYKQRKEQIQEEVGLWIEALYEMRGEIKPLIKYLLED